jgi:hypothetical protein
MPAMNIMIAGMARSNMSLASGFSLAPCIFNLVSCFLYLTLYLTLQSIYRSIAEHVQRLNDKGERHCHVKRRIPLQDTETS